VIVYSFATRLQSGYLPFFLPLPPLVVYAGAHSVSTNTHEADQVRTRWTLPIYNTSF
jgi:hypothetical protein